MRGKRERRVAAAPSGMAPEAKAVGRRWGLVLGAALLAAIGAGWLLSRSASPPISTASSTPVEPATFVGSTACATCHAAQHAAWAGSQHAHAMQPAATETVLGNFNDARHTQDGVTSTFLRRDGKFVVRTDGPDGKLADFEVRYTFGLAPLQQYLVELPGGRLQALAVSWDARAADAGGQRWFRQYPDEKIDFRDELHWTGRLQNWNFMCADCHSTNVRKGYNAAQDRFATTWSEVAVGCEACHGPGSAHLAWAKAKSSDDPAKGLTVALDERRQAKWTIDAASGNARRAPERRSNREVDTCAPCHSRRAQIAEGWRAGAQFMDHYLPTVLSPGLYHADGQQRDEVFVWASFLQSRMHRAGVTCSDCHDPHTQKLRAPGNAVCGQCHLASKYDSPSHHHHPESSPGAQCANCHMPATTYMVVDPRRDHSLRVPRPDLSVRLGTPNACSGCHRESTAQWAADAVERWYGPQRRAEPHFGEALDAGRRARPGAARGLVAVATSVAYPPIVRASAIELLARYPGRAADEAVRAALGDADPLVRHAALVAFQPVSEQLLLSAVAPLLGDPVRAVRIEAARKLAPLAGRLDASTRPAFDRAIGEYEAVQNGNLDRPEAWLNLGNVASARGDAARAEDALRNALKRDPRFIPAWANLADLKRAQGRDAEAEAVLREGLRAVPGAAALHQSLGLTLIRLGLKSDALAEFAAAHRLGSGEPRHAYLYALALQDSGRRSEALKILDAAAKSTGDREVLLALATMRGEGGDEAGARQALKTLAAINPDEPALAQFR